MHHATNGDLDRRGIGDIWTLTVREYLSSSRMTRINYRFVRNPFVLFVFAPLFLFLVLERFPSSKAKPRGKTFSAYNELQPFDLVFNNVCYFWRSTFYCNPSYYDGSCRNLWNLAFLCSAPVRGYLLGPRRRLGLHRSGNGRK